MKQVLMTMFTFGASAGGITRVLMNRGRMLREAGVDAQIALFAWDPGLKATVELLKQQGRLAPDQPVLNLYTYYAAIADGQPARDGSGRAPDVQTHACPTRHETTEDGSGAGQHYVSSTGQTFLTLHFDADTGQVARIALRDPRRSEAVLFTCMRELHTHWLSELARASTPCAIIADAPKSASAVLAVSEDSVFRILTIHNNHFVKPYTFGSPWRDTYAGILRSFNRADALAVLTEQQKDDIESELGPRSNIFVIPNSVTAFGEPSKPVKRDPMKVVVVARYHKIKGLPKIIKAFERVLRRFPQAKLELYGSGEEEQALRALIALRGMSESVALMGFASDIASVLRSASVVVSASDFEGFGLGIAEALSVGTPVVSMDCAYGPAEIISDDEDGYLVYDIATLGERIIELLAHPGRARLMGQAARQNMERFSPKSIASRWLTLFALLEERRRRQTQSAGSLNGNIGSSPDSSHE
jgi:glycosyltransferase involved in cell wall biosynthesis